VHNGGRCCRWCHCEQSETTFIIIRLRLSIHTCARLGTHLHITIITILIPLSIITHRDIHLFPQIEIPCWGYVSSFAFIIVVVFCQCIMHTWNLIIRSSHFLCITSASAKGSRKSIKFHSYLIKYYKVQASRRFPGSPCPVRRKDSPSSPRDSLSSL